MFGLRKFHNKNFFLDLILSAFLLFITLSRNIWRIKGTDYNWDLLNYHLNNATNTQPLVLHPAGIQSFFSPLLDKILLPLHTIIPQPYSGLLLLAPLIGNFIIIRYLFLRTFLIGKFKFPNSTALVSIFSAMALSQINNTMGDLILTPIALLVIFYLFKGIAKRRNKSLYLSGLLLGLLIGLKLSFSYLIFPVALLVLILLAVKRISLKTFSIWCLVVLFTFTALAIPHASKLYKEFGNPVFPLFNAFFRSPNFDYVNFRDNRFGFRNILDYFSVPFKIAIGDNGGTAELIFRDARPLLLSLALILGCLSMFVQVFHRGIQILRGDDFSELILLGSFVFFAYIIWAEYFGIQRYIIPIEILGFIFSIAFFVTLTQRIFNSNRLSNFIVLLLILSTALSTTGVNWGHSSMQSHSTAFQQDSYALADVENAAYLLVDQPLAFLKFEARDSSLHFWFGPSFNAYDNLQQKKLLKDRQIFTLSYDKNVEHLDSKLSNYSLRSKGTCKEIHLDFNNGLTPNILFLCDTESNLK